MKTLLRYGLALGMALSLSANARANLIINGSFEDGNFSGAGTSRSLKVSMGDAWTVPGWTAVKQGFHWDKSHSLDTGEFIAAASGSKFVELRYLEGIAQTFATTVGQEYHVSFLLSTPLVTSSAVQVSVAGTSQQFVNTAPAYNLQLQYTECAFNFIANSDNSTLWFQSVAAGLSSGPFIDCVSVEALAPVPEPATYLAGLGVLALMGATARRKPASGAGGRN